jgi:hypothetical protein
VHISAVLQCCIGHRGLIQPPQRHDRRRSRSAGLLARSRGRDTRSCLITGSGGSRASALKRQLPFQKWAWVAGGGSAAVLPCAAGEPNGGGLLGKSALPCSTHRSVLAHGRPESTLAVRELRVA